jgi:ribosome-associated toxin RatA of RatAB toxin-antitoxin module
MREPGARDDFFPSTTFPVAVREISATATGVAEASIDKVFSQLRDVEHYPQWYPVGAKSVDVLERDADGLALSVDAVLAAVAGPLRKNFDVRLAVETTVPTRVALVRIADDRGDHESLTISWTLRELGPQQTELTVEMVAHLDVPPFLPVGQVAQEAAGGFLAAAIAHAA